MKTEFLNVPELGECCCLADIVPPFQVCFHFYSVGYFKVQSFNKFSFFPSLLFHYKELYSSQKVGFFLIRSLLNGFQH